MESMTEIDAYINAINKPRSINKAKKELITLSKMALTETLKGVLIPIIEIGIIIYLAYNISTVIYEIILKTIFQGAY